MPGYRAQVVFQRDTGLPEDIVTNTFHFFSPDPSTFDVWASIGTRIERWLTVAQVGAVSRIDAFLASVLQPLVTVKVYDMADPVPRVPVYVDTFNIAPAGNSIPEEVALCMSFQANPISGGIQARRRGRIYFGPLAETNTLAILNGRVIPSNDLQVSLSRSALGLAWQAGDQIGTEDLIWVVRSDVGGVVTTPEIDVAWVDLAFDTQRRRGSDPHLRTTTPIPQ